MYGTRSLWALLSAGTLSACVGAQHGGGPTPALPGAEAYGRVRAVSTAPAKGSTVTSATNSLGDHGFKTIYTFQGGTDSAGVQARMTNVDGMLYGTAHDGGSSGYGTTFTVNPETGAEKVVYSFMGGSDGLWPEAHLLYLNGMLFGTTSSVPEPGFPDGDGNGTVFATTTSGAEHALHGFTGSPDGANPEGFVIGLGGMLYGTTFVGGTGSCKYSLSTGCGTVFVVNPRTGAETVIHSFTCCTDGAGPRAGLVDVDGTLYGTTYFGGAKDYGSVFSITPAGTEKVIYSFTGGVDGSHPQAALTRLNGKLYGTTNGGGDNGEGAIFSITTTGIEHTLDSFCCGPEAGVIPVHGKLYGTTSGDGSADGGNVFSVAPTGLGEVLHTFTGGPNGGSPEDALVDVNGTLYGTTRLSGGARVGTVFKIRP